MATKQTWVCGECRNTCEFEPDFDDDVPDGWFTIEDRECHYVACSLACLKHFADNYKQVLSPLSE